jgi:DNA-binding transcriptional LysR family regulator
LVCAALAGGGLALQPTYLHLADGSLQRVLPDWTLPDMAVYALYTSRRHLSAAVRALLDFLVDRFAEVPWSLSPVSMAEQR